MAGERLFRVEVRDRVLGRAGLSASMARTARAVAECLFTTRRGPPDAARLDWLLDEVDDYLKGAGSRARSIFRASTLAIEAVGPLYARRPLPFSRLSYERRLVALERLEAGPLGLAVFGVKAPLCFIYYEHPTSAAEIGYDGECLVGANEGGE